MQEGERIRYGFEIDEQIRGRAERGEPCRDCGCMQGELHRPYCCIERCPQCEVGQRLSGCDRPDCPRT